MSRYPRYLPQGGALVEVTYRTIQGRFLLRPNRALNPCWAHLSWGEYIRRIQDLVRKIEAEAALERELRGVEVVGKEEVTRRDPQTRPNSVKESPAPSVHAASKRARLEWREAFAMFLLAYREAAKLLRQGMLDAPFPEGCFPPGLPFVGDIGGPAAAPG